MGLEEQVERLESHIMLLTAELERERKKVLMLSQVVSSLKNAFGASGMESLSIVMSEILERTK